MGDKREVDPSYFAEFDLFQEAMNDSALLRAFLAPHGHLKQWEEEVRNHTRPIEGKFDVRLSDGWVIAAPLIFNAGFYGDIFSSEYLFTEDKKRDQLRRLGVDLLFLGYDVGEVHIGAVFQPVVDKVRTLPYINPYMRSRPEVNDYVRLALSVGPEVKKYYPDADYSLPSSEAIGWTPGAWEGVLDTIPMDDFTGEHR
jgi:hypothetical protein